MIKRPGVRRLLLFFLVFALAVTGWQLLRGAFSVEEKHLRSGIREAITQNYPEYAREAAQQFGLKRYPSKVAPDNDMIPVVLVHGLDDPGKVWMNLAPHLAKQGFPVWILNYPDDQAIEDSARFMLEEMLMLRRQGIQTLDIVAHSMGGLVSREMLTIGPTDTLSERPKVKNLIMVGTPNHGSELARFRALSEFRDHLAGLFNGDFHWLSWIADGAGEAGIDLIPGSDFLQKLNSKPAPADTKLNVIAAVLSKPDQSRLLTKLESPLPDGLQKPIQLFTSALQDVIESVGDGLVDLDSARLEGAGFYVVEGNHMSLIRNLTSSSQRVPPAIPIIQKQLLLP